MKVTEHKTEQCLGGSGMNTIRLVRVIEVPDGTKLAEGQEKAPAETPVHDWQKEEVN